MRRTDEKKRTSRWFFWAVGLGSVCVVTVLVALFWPRPEMPWWKYVPGGLALIAAWIFAFCVRGRFLEDSRD